MPPEWLDTNNAPPVGGKVSKPRTSGRNHRLITGVTALIRSSVKVGSHFAISGCAIRPQPTLPLRVRVPSSSPFHRCLGRAAIPRIAGTKYLGDRRRPPWRQPRTNGGHAGSKDPFEHHRSSITWLGRCSDDGIDDRVSGFLGSALLPGILKRTDSSAICLVQPKFATLAERRVAELSIADPFLEDRIKVVEGDITQPGLGLAAGRLYRATEAWHFAAAYDLTVPRDAAVRVNVDGTRNCPGRT